MFDVGCSSFRSTPYGINATCEFLQNKLAIMEVSTVADPTPPSRGRGKNISRWALVKYRMSNTEYAISDVEVMYSIIF
jgi:hypothetical protein